MFRVPIRYVGTAIATTPATVATPSSTASHVCGAAMPMNRLTNGDAGTGHLPLFDRNCAELRNSLPNELMARNAIAARPIEAIATEISMPRKIVFPGCLISPAKYDETCPSPIAPNRIVIEANVTERLNADDPKPALWASLITLVTPPYWPK